MTEQLFSNEKFQIFNKNFRFQRWFYSFIGISTVFVILFLTYSQIRDMKNDNYDFAFCLLLIIHSSITTAMLTTMTIILLSGYTGVHFYIRFFLFPNNSKTDFYLIAIRLGFVLFLLILLVPWTNTMVHTHRMNNPFKEEIIYPRSTTFSWFLYLDFLLIISLFILNVRSRSELNRNQLIFTGVGLALALIWLGLGVLMANSKIRHRFFFHILSISQISYIIYTTYKALMEYAVQPKLDHNTLFSLLLLIFLSSTSDLKLKSVTTFPPKVSKSAKNRSNDVKNARETFYMTTSSYAFYLVAQILLFI
ncbi:unnamed protein product [Adineta ricciae]|uniref:Uncharacterized protein n=1 Tax=Adineta ricciae TaxID=249248 RepID=A0A813Z4I0_ADIRI|nr:unnamed protein product [Adineta ricciae]